MGLAHCGHKKMENFGIKNEHQNSNKVQHREVKNISPSQQDKQIGKIARLITTVEEIPKESIQKRQIRIHLSLQKKNSGC